MQMYQWRSRSLLREYRDGYIVVMAISVEEARQMATDHLDQWIAEHREWADEDDVREMREAHDADLAAEPTEHQVLFILGGE